MPHQTVCKRGHKLNDKNSKMMLHSSKRCWYRRCMVCHAQRQRKYDNNQMKKLANLLQWAIWY